MRGRIIEASGGIFTVETSEGNIPAVSKGIFRLKGIKPVAGDRVELRLGGAEEPLITDVYDRKNLLVRPPLANIDIALLVVSACEPSPNAFVLDKLTAIFESKDIETVFVFTKTDITAADEYSCVYESIGYRTFFVNNITGAGAGGIPSYIEGKTAALIGNSGVGKSSLFNILVPGASQKTSEISKKLGRGRHTTRGTVLYRVGENSYVADTPGFSTVEVSRYGKIPSEELISCFREFPRYAEKCKFKDCSHLKEESCAVREAVKSGKIARSRYESYSALYSETSKAEKRY